MNLSSWIAPPIRMIQAASRRRSGGGTSGTHLKPVVMRELLENRYLSGTHVRATVLSVTDERSAGRSVFLR